MIKKVKVIGLELLDNFELTEVEFEGDAINFYVPTCFDPYILFETEKQNEDDSMNVYVNYYPESGNVELYAMYHDNLTYNDVEIQAELDEEGMDFLYNTVSVYLYNEYLNHWNETHDEGHPVCLGEFQDNEMKELEILEEIL